MDCRIVRLHLRFDLHLLCLTRSMLITLRFIAAKVLTLQLYNGISIDYLSIFFKPLLCKLPLRFNFWIECGLVLSKIHCRFL
jgi:hypothetical protein